MAARIVRDSLDCLCMLVPMIFPEDIPLIDGGSPDHESSPT